MQGGGGGGQKEKNCGFLPPNFSMRYYYHIYTSKKIYDPPFPNSHLHRKLPHSLRRHVNKGELEHLYLGCFFLNVYKSSFSSKLFFPHPAFCSIFLQYFVVGLDEEGFLIYDFYGYLWRPARYTSAREEVMLQAALQLSQKVIIGKVDVKILSSEF